MFEVVDHEKLTHKVHRLRISAPHVARKAQPGQFVILILDEKGERVPFTISDWDRQAGTVDFVFLEVGRTTERMARLQKGDTLAHFVGPLGKPAEIDKFGHVVCVVSGYGLAGMVPIIKRLKEKGNRITTIMQAADNESLYNQEALKQFSDHLLIGVGGAGGGPATALKPLEDMLKNLDHEPMDRITAMASICLMRFIAEATRNMGIKTTVHMAPVMVDGTGMCGACRLAHADGTQFACVHGPEFDAHKIKAWDTLMARRCTYADDSIMQPGFKCDNCSQW
ncbi:MAG: ferredoxin-NADP reductase [Desulfobacterales bacterium CG23_combo_of_CG06-09_8_20_14_all_51_8]|nr:MAG: ferredoxin-NADP reductase [Desulfobacterales bacterium CG23_combo_of_CG06-09_8_20_14_all_51_8]